MIETNRPPMVKGSTPLVELEKRFRYGAEEQQRALESFRYGKDASIYLRPAMQAKII